MFAFVNQSRLSHLTIYHQVLQALVNFVYLSHCTLHVVVSISVDIIIIHNYLLSA